MEKLQGHVKLVVRCQRPGEGNKSEMMHRSMNKAWSGLVKWPVIGRVLQWFQVLLVALCMYVCIDKLICFSLIYCYVYI